MSDKPSFHVENENEHPVSDELKNNLARLKHSSMSEQIQGDLSPAMLPIELLLPEKMKKRVRALKKLQHEFFQVESEYSKEIHRLDCKFTAKYETLWQRRAEIVNGSYEPTDDESTWEDIELDPADDLKNQLQELKLDFDEDADGLPEFWLRALKNSPIIMPYILENDEPVLKHLTDIKLEMTEQPPSFTLHFHFSENEWFTNKVLTKKYNLNIDLDPECPLDYEGTVVDGCEGCSVDWKSGKDVTVRIVKKKQKHKGKGQTRTVTKTEKVDSFFNFFSPPDTAKDMQNESTDSDAYPEMDFALGHHIRSVIIPKAVLAFTGDLEDEDDVDDDEDDEDDDYDDDDDEGGNQSNNNAAGTGGGLGGGKQADCKQQ